MNTTRMIQIKRIQNEFLSPGIRTISDRLSLRGIIRIPFLICGIFSLLTIASCKKNSTPPVAIDLSYFPLTTGKYIIYDVDCTGYSNFDILNPQTLSTYQIREEVDSPYIDNSGNQAFKIIRSRREDDTSPWVITDIWSANLTDHTGEKVEENLRFIKLNFPILLNRQWFGNSYIQSDSNLSYLDGWIYEYTSIHQPLTLNGLSFDSTLTVTQQIDSNAIQQYIFIEKYAKHVGMIYKYEDTLSTQPGKPWDGHIITMMAKEFN